MPKARLADSARGGQAPHCSQAVYSGLGVQGGIREEAEELRSLLRLQRVVSDLKDRAKQRGLGWTGGAQEGS